MSNSRSEGAWLNRWQQQTAWPVIGLSVAYIAVYVVPIFWYPLRPGLATAFHVAEYTIWGLFVMDYAVQFALAADRRYF